MSKEPLKKRESASGELPAKTGLPNRLDTGQLRALDGITLDELTEAPPPPDDPYNKAVPPSLDSTQKQKRRSLDDMRQLSDTIKASRKATEAMPAPIDAAPTTGEMDAATTAQLQTVAELARHASADLNHLLSVATTHIGTDQRRRLEEAAQLLRYAIRYLSLWAPGKTAGGG